MGLLFRSRRRRSGGLLKLVFILGVMIFAAPMLLGGSGGVFTSCQNLMRSLGNMGSGLCVGVQRVMIATHDISGKAAQLAGSMRTLGSDGSTVSAGMQGSWRERVQALSQRLDSGSNWQGGQGASALVSMDSVRDMMQQGGASAFGGGASSNDRLKAAFGSFMAGQSIGQSQGSDLESQLAWYKNGAGMGEYGILSQLKLGSLYMNGAEGLTPNPAQAYDYNMQALGSLQQLQSSNSPQARAALQALPIEPGKLQEQLQETLRQLQTQQ
jgi:hypothetical protein